MKVLIIIPAYSEEQNIEKTVNDVKTNTNYDYIVINDCSKDNTKEVCEKNNFNMLSLPINYGLTSGIQLGMKYAYKNNYDIAIQFDGDGQHQAKFLKDLVNEIENGNTDIAIGSRFVTEKKPFTARMLGSSVISFFIKIVSIIIIKPLKFILSMVRMISGKLLFPVKLCCRYIKSKISFNSDIIKHKKKKIINDNYDNDISNKQS